VNAGTLLRYLADGALAGRVRSFAMGSTAMFFALPAVAVGTAWANATHIAQADKPRPLDPIGGST
jgi:hypothetical protein